MVLALALLVVGGVALYGALTSEPAAPGPATSKAEPPAESSEPARRVPQSASRSPQSRIDALVVRCRVARCGVFISSSPDNNVLFNGNLAQGEERQANEPRMNLVVSDGSAVDVFINGKLQPRGAPGRKKTYTIIKPS